MESPIRLPMMAFDVKIASKDDEFGNVIRSLIRERYQERPENFDREVAALEELRARACLRPRPQDHVIVKKYLGQLHFIKSRFELGSNDR